MSKELTPLEVSNQLKDFVLEFVKNGLDRRFIHGSFDIIETALKQHEAMLEALPLNCKNNRALEIIREKRVDVGWLMGCESLSEYNNVIGTSTHRLLNEEQFYLLKEVLL